MIDQINSEKIKYIAQRCPNCNGWGTVTYKKIKCHTCNGKGTIVINQETGEIKEVKNG